MNLIRIELVREHNGIPLEAVECAVHFDESGEIRLDASSPLTEHERALVLERVTPPCR